MKTESRPAAQGRDQARPRGGALVREYVESLGVALLLALIIKTFILQAFSIPSRSMESTMLVGDHILVDRLVYALRDPKPGDIAVFRTRGIERLNRDAVEKGKNYYVKRVIGLPGQRIAINEDGTITVDGAILATPWRVSGEGYESNPSFSDAPNATRGTTFTIPSDRYFVLGDNTHSSFDSRYWGTVPRNNLVGRALATYWPLPRVRLFRP